MSPKIFQRISENRSGRRRVGDDDLGAPVRDDRLELGPASDGCERVARSENDPEVRQELTRKKRYDVQLGRVSGLATCNDTNTRQCVTKCVFTLQSETIRCTADVRADKTPRRFPASLGVLHMSRRRPLVLLALAISSLVLSACSDMTAPRSDTPCSGYVDSGGRCQE